MKKQTYWAPITINQVKILMMSMCVPNCLLNQPIYIGVTKEGKILPAINVVNLTELIKIKGEIVLIDVQYDDLLMIEDLQIALYLELMWEGKL